MFSFFHYSKDRERQPKVTATRSQEQIHQSALLNHLISMVRSMKGTLDCSPEASPYRCRELQGQQPRWGRGAYAQRVAQENACMCGLYWGKESIRGLEQ
jgi:hypothetical protein